MKRALVILTDAYGSYGGISKFNRNFCEALASSELREIVVYPRIVKDIIKDKIPKKIKFVNNGVTSISGYILNLVVNLINDSNFNMIICGHINLISISWFFSKVFRQPLVMIIHGIEAWSPRKSIITVNRHGIMTHLSQ